MGALPEVPPRSLALRSGPSSSVVAAAQAIERQRDAAKIQRIVDSRQG
jgi:hypothetical protein